MKMKQLLRAGPFAAVLTFAAIAASAEPIASSASSNIPHMLSSNGNLILVDRGGHGGGGWAGGGGSFGGHGGGGGHWGGGGGHWGGSGGFRSFGGNGGFRSFNSGHSWHGGRNWNGGRRWVGGDHWRGDWHRGGPWRHHHHHHGRFFFYGGPVFYDYGYYDYGYNSCYSECLYYHSYAYCNLYWRDYCY